MKTSIFLAFYTKRNSVILPPQSSNFPSNAENKIRAFWLRSSSRTHCLSELVWLPSKWHYQGYLTLKTYPFRTLCFPPFFGTFRVSLWRFTQYLDAFTFSCFETFHEASYFSWHWVCFFEEFHHQAISVFFISPKFPPKYFFLVLRFSLFLLEVA